MSNKLLSTSVWHKQLYCPHGKTCRT